MHLCPFRDEAAPRSRDGQFCSDLESGETYKSKVRKKAQKSRNPRARTLGDLDWPSPFAQ